MLYRFKTNLLGKQILQVSRGPQEIDATDDTDGEKITVTIWRDADRYEAEELLVLYKEV